MYGHISVYERGGKYQLYAEQLKPAGVGELAIAFEQLKNRLEAEGLFAESRKRPLPPYPRKIGVVTSPTGAAIRDIIQILDRRAPDIEIVLCPARVQGEGAAAEARPSHRQLEINLDDIDVLIVGRGGGAPEDLWPFNDESVARAIYQSPQPVISAVATRSITPSPITWPTVAPQLPRPQPKWSPVNAVLCASESPNNKADC